MDRPSRISLHSLTLKFSGEVSSFETPFRIFNFRASLPYNRAAVIVGVIFYSLLAMPGVIFFLQDRL